MDDMYLVWCAGEMASTAAEQEIRETKIVALEMRIEEQSSEYRAALEGGPNQS